MRLVPDIGASDRPAGAKTVAVFGSGSGLTSDDPLYREAYVLGRLLAEDGYTLVNGGYAGVMAAASKGAHDAGGRVVGYTIALFEPEPPNPWLSEERRVATFGERLQRICEDSDAYVALHGGVGTLTELLYTWSLLLTGAIPERPLIALGDPWPGLVEYLVAQGYHIPSDYYRLVRLVDGPAEALAILADHFARREDARGPGAGPGVAPRR